MEPLTLPLEYAAIEKILPHRYPFLLVDRIIELEMDKRIVGVKNISSNELYLMRSPSGAMVLPPTILTEVIAQVGAILILAKPENQEKLPFFAGIEKVPIPPARPSWRCGRHRSEREAASQPRWASSAATPASTARSSSKAR